MMGSLPTTSEALFRYGDFELDVVRYVLGLWKALQCRSRQCRSRGEVEELARLFEIPRDAWGFHAALRAAL